MQCSEAIAVMHDYFDEEIDAASASELKKHLESCPSCRQLFKQMESTEALLRVPLKTATPARLKESIMSSIPRTAKRKRWGRMLRLHPIAAAAFVILMIVLVHYTSRVYSDQDMVVQGALDQLFITGDTLVVPEGVTVYGNLKVKRGRIQIDGNVEGDVTVINGSYSLASTAYISGRVTMIDAALDWVWYRIRNMFMFSRGPSFRGGSFLGFP
ncbi:zf-HC2 domain-containing protein [Paenibacillus sp. YN15]|uniref:zf-HC2 domain-containing protein n=1 Tax=Paenibacillus sp. YN15 TaxID=1742774 RepID=UPI00215B7FAC|nr:zf-HC2 domain-containing protein [Paenibacillus sp. YN15]